MPRIGYLDEAVTAEFLDAGVEDLASNSARTRRSRCVV
jgi:hypothetical protein